MRDAMNRRTFLGNSMTGLGAMAVSQLMGAPRTHFPARAKAVIYLSMSGAPSQLDLFDFKPKLKEMSGQKVPQSLIEGERFAFLSGQPSLLGTPFRFTRHGQAGHEISELLPHTARVADELAFVYSMKTDQFNHSPAELLLFTGHARPGRPSMGAWINHGLGSEATDLPGFVVLQSGRPGRCGVGCIGSGFLPTHLQGVTFRSGGDPVLSLSNPEGMPSEVRRDSLDTLAALNRQKQDQCGDPEIATRIASYEMAYRMQSSVPDLMDITREPAHIHKLYGTEPGKKSFSNNALLARRLVERGVRFVMLNHGEWDHHGGPRINLVQHLPQICREVDQGSAALVEDLKQRGVLDSTLVVWGGEVGRSPMLQGSVTETLLGRDHHRSFTLWMAGGGIKAGVRYGATDDLGYKVAADPATPHDLQATILNRLGLDHLRLTFKYQGRDYRLTDVHGQVMEKLLA